MCSTLHPVLAGKLFYVRLLAGKKIADLGLLVFKSIFSEQDQGRENETFNDFSFFRYSLHMSLTAGCGKKKL